MSVGKESIRRAAGTGAAKKPAKKTAPAVKKSVITTNVEVTGGNKIIRLKDDLPTYLL